MLTGTFALGALTTVMVACPLYTAAAEGYAAYKAAQHAGLV